MTTRIFSGLADGTVAVVEVLAYEPSRENTNNVVSVQVQHKSGCTVTEDG